MIINNNAKPIDSRKEQFLQAMGVQVWKEHENSSIEVGEESNEMTEWNKIEREVAGCQLCELANSRANTVFGVGNKQADLLIIGEAPGATEDAKGEPFVGRAGKLLDTILASINLKREDVFIANILKCRPPNNRDPSPREVELCTPYLTQQIALLKPKLIVAVGRIAAHFLLNTTQSLGSMRGQKFVYGEAKTPLVVTYHPAYLLRNPREKVKAYADWLNAQQFLALG